MGVKGLWKLIECSGTPVPVETLEHKILAVDVSIWLHQAVRGFRGPGGAAVANAHLLTLFHRICKLLFYRIRPVFVFDGGVPHLKKQTLASRRLRREVAANKAKQVRERLLSNLLKSQAVRNALGRSGPGPSTVHVVRQKKVQKDVFELPPLPEESQELFKTDPIKDKKSIVKNYKLPNLHQFEFESEEFKSLPLETQHDILSELQDTRKQNSWNSLNRMPQESNNFAVFQMERLMKRYKFQSTLDDIRVEMQKKKATEMEEEMFGDLEKHVSLTQRIISEDAAHSVYIKKIDEAKQESDFEKAVKEEKGKALLKRNKEEFEKDFLMELEKQGIVTSRRMSDSESDSDFDDDYIDLPGSASKEDGENDEKLSFDGNALLKVVNNLLDNDGLSQEEILALIKQDGPGEEISKPSSSNSNFDGPSTSGKAPGFVFNPDADSSDDDSDFIEVPQSGSPPPLLDGKTKVEDEDSSTDNVKKVLETKNNSLWIKIMQQKLDDVVHKSNEKSPKKAKVDSRVISNAKEKDKDNSNSTKGKSVAISLNFDVIPPLKAEDDIFADIFSDNQPDIKPDIKLPPEEKKKHSNLEAITRKLSRYSDIQSKQLATSKAAKPKPTDQKEMISDNELTRNFIDKHYSQTTTKSTLLDRSENKLPFGSTGIKTIDEGLQVAKKPSETKKVDEIELMSSSDESDSEEEAVVKMELPKSITGKADKKVFRTSKPLPLENEDEAAVDDVQIMSSSGESDSDEDVAAAPTVPHISNEDKNHKLDIRIHKEEEKSKLYRDDDDDVDHIVTHAVDREKFSNDKKESVVTSGADEGLNKSKLLLKSKTTLKSDDSVRAAPSESKASDEEQEDSEKLEEEKGSIVRIKKDDEGQENVKQSSEFNGTKDFIETEKSDSILSEQRKNTSDEVNEDLGSPERPLEYSADELKRLEGELAEEQRALVAQAQKVERISSNLNDQMYGESQHLLQLFGIPYLVAPMEAEAQCAYLDAIKLSSGTITDDSDIFLFGGTKVYKNFFNQTKHVEFFKTDNIAANLGLNRDKMITLALLTGSDYTEGIESVGAVSAMEVLAEFPGEGIDCLRAFKKWWNVAHRNISGAYLSKVKQKMSQIHLPESFPSEAVVKAYLEPEVDESKEKFSWAVPNVDALRMFTMEKFGWNRAKADEILLPVMKKLGVKATQMRIDSFFTNIKLVKDDKVHSKRMQDAIAKAKGEEPPSSAIAKSPIKRLRAPAKKKAPAKKRKAKESQESDMEDDELEEEEEKNVKDTPGKKPTRTLLIDPSESSTGPEVPQDKPKAKAKAPRKKKEDSQKSGGPARSVRDVDDDYVPPRKLTKEVMFKALLKKQTICQREADKEQMDERKKRAAELLKNSAKRQKR